MKRSFSWPPIIKGAIQAAMRQMKSGKAAGPEVHPWNFQKNLETMEFLRPN